MKKIFFAVFALVMSINANAFEFDGIDLNGNIADITKQVSAKGYAFDDVKNGLVGNCQGTDILLRFLVEPFRVIEVCCAEEDRQLVMLHHICGVGEQEVRVRLEVDDTVIHKEMTVSLQEES